MFENLIKWGLTYGANGDRTNGTDKASDHYQRIWLKNDYRIGSWAIVFLYALSFVFAADKESGIQKKNTHFRLRRYVQKEETAICIVLLLL